MDLIDSVVIKNDSKIVYLIIDGLGGLALEKGKGTELEVAKTPNLDRLAAESICGLLDPIAPGITPGSGPAHFALFGYEPTKANIGRGILEASGIDFPLTERDVVARINFATIDKDGNIIDRRAGRISTQTCERISKRLKENIKLPGIELFVEPVKEHRGVLVLRGDGLRGELEDTDPQRIGVPPLEPKPLSPEAGETASLVRRFLSQAREILACEERANMVLLRGFSRYRSYPSLKERYGLRSLTLATYPMYQGIARLLGMEVLPSLTSREAQFAALRENFPNYDFFYLHIKETDSCGEDGDFDAKVKVTEEIDNLVPQITDLSPDVLVVTGDHSTPAKMASHSFHPVPVLIHSPLCRRDRVEKFDELSCIYGGLGRILMVNLMGLALAHAGRLTKFGA